MQSLEVSFQKHDRQPHIALGQPTRHMLHLLMYFKCHILYLCSFNLGGIPSTEFGFMLGRNGSMSDRMTIGIGLNNHGYIKEYKVKNTCNFYFLITEPSFSMSNNNMIVLRRPIKIQECSKELM